MNNNFNPYHLVDTSPWPLLASNSALTLVLSSLVLINSSINITLLTAFTVTAAISYLWWNDIHREASIQGNHSHLVINGLKTGIILFILSEVLFFASFFWAFLHSSISPVVELGQAWAPRGIAPFNPMSVPLLNTILLLSSGVSVTWCHHALLNSELNNAAISLNSTILLGTVFSTFQGFEYVTAPFSISDSTFASCFFIATGFHGLHVIIGTIFLFCSINRILNNSINHIVGFECAAWYWHFVDVVWLFLYAIVYWWGTWSNPIQYWNSWHPNLQNYPLSQFSSHPKLTTNTLSLYHGFTSKNSPQLPFSFQFFVIALLFLIFDIENALVLA